MKRLLTSLTFKIGMIIIFSEIIVLGVVGSLYISRFDREINKRMEEHVQLPGKLMNAGLLRLASLTNQKTMNQLMAEELVIGLAVRKDLRIFASQNPDLRGKKVTDIDGIAADLFDFGNPRERILKPEGHLISVAPIFHPGQSEPRVFVYFKVRTSAAETEKAGWPEALAAQGLPGLAQPDRE